MAKYIYKVAEPGMGKTKWLMQQAINEQARGNHVVLLTADSPAGSAQYQKFVEGFFARYQSICRVDRAEHITYVQEDDIVLIDDFMQLSTHLNAFGLLDQRAQRIYVTVNGVTAEEWDARDIPDPNQLSLFDAEANYAG